MVTKRVFGLLVLGLALALTLAAWSLAHAQVITLKGASMFADDHAYNQTMLRFAELVQKYYGKPVNFVLHRNRELGLEKDYFAYMSQGLSVDYAVVAPAHASTFSKMVTLLDVPFLFRDVGHWKKVLEAGEALNPIAEDVLKRGDVMTLGYVGGGVRNIVAKKPVRNMAELKNLSLRVMGAPILTRTFEAIGAAPTVIAYDEVYNAIQAGVIQAGENEASGFSQMKWHEVAPEISLTQHTVTVRPFFFSGKTFRTLPPDLQEAILKAAPEATAHGREWERRVDEALLDRLRAEGKIRIYPFADRVKLLELTAPVKEAFAKEVGAEGVLSAIDAVK